MTESQYDAWTQFLETPEGRSMSPAQRRTMATLRIDEELGEMTVGDYQAFWRIVRGIGQH